SGHRPELFPPFENFGNHRCTPLLLTDDLDSTASFGNPIAIDWHTNVSLVWMGTSNEEDYDGLPSSSEETAQAPRAPEQLLRDTFAATLKMLTEQAQHLGSRLRGLLNGQWRF